MIPAGVAITILFGLFLAWATAVTTSRGHGRVRPGRGVRDGAPTRPPYDWERDGL